LRHNPYFCARTLTSRKQTHAQEIGLKEI